MIDLAVATTPFLDITFLGLEAIPRPGEERYARELLRSPGGGATTAIGAARLGLATALLSPLGADDVGRTVRAALEAEGIRLVEPHPGATATTVVMPANGDRAMVTYDEGARTRREDLEAIGARTVVCGLDELPLVPRRTAAYVSCGAVEAHEHAGSPPAVLGSAHALLVNESEAHLLTGRPDPAEAADRLAALGCDVVVTLGADGALGVIGGRAVAVPGADAGPAVDTTGAGDLFAAAYVWAELRGAPPEERLRWAVLYAALSVTVATAFAGAATASRLLEEGARHGLAMELEE